MKSNKTLKGKTGKDLLNLLNSKDKNKGTQDSSDLIAPKSENEIIIFGFWKTLLGHENFGTGDDFFVIGGNSIKAIQLLSRISNHFSIQLETTDIFLQPTISQLALLIDAKQNEKQDDQSISKSKIEIQERPALIPLSYSQERLLFIDKLEGSVQYHIPAVLRLTGKPDLKALNFAFEEIINRHEVLRTVYEDQDGLAFQKIKDKDKWQINVIDGSIYKNDTDGFKKYIQQLINKPFDLTEDNMLRADLITINKDKDEYVLVITMHHIASDGWSMSILVKEVVELYSSYVDKRPNELPDLPVQYADYSIWQRENLTDDVLENRLQFWKEYLNEVPALELPTDFSRPAVQSVRGSALNFNIDPELNEKLNLLSQKNGSTLFMTLLTAFNILLYKYSGQEDICVGTPVAGRQKEEIEGLIGFFVNSLALRNEINGKATFTELLKQVKINALNALEHQDVPFEKVVEAVVKEREVNRSPLFQVMFVFQNTPEIDDLNMKDVEISREDEIHSTSKFDLTFNFDETEEGLDGEVEYSTDLYMEATVRRMTDHFKVLLNEIIESPDQSIDSFSIISKTEEQQLLTEFNNEEVVYPKDKNIAGLIEEQVLKTPDGIALVYENKKLTYRELNERSNQLAHYLMSKGVKEETLVPICIERSPDMIIGILGILKSGGVYVPVDPDYPEERINYILDDTSASVIVSSKDSSVKLPVTEKLEIVNTDADLPEIEKHSKENPQITIKPDNAAYIIYTSGSTGKPKGVIVEHRNVIRLLITEPSLFDFNEKDVWTMFHSFCFDFSVWEMYGALFFGGKIVVVPKDATKDATLFAELLHSEKVTVLNQIPSTFYAIQESIIESKQSLNLRYLIFGGEALDPAKLKQWKESYPECKIINMYGITETTVHVTYQEIEQKQIESGISVIGKPIPTLDLYILDKNQKLLPIGIAGELCVGGDGLARGYLNRQELTKEKFIDNPFSNEPGARLYRSGDLGVRLQDGNIEYLGRIDEQVKIRGYRIELGEIESVLNKYESVSQAIILAKEDNTGNKYLVGYIVPKENFERAEIISYLKSKLPEYMVPNLWVELESFPLTASGKINKKALPDPDASTLITNEYVEPVTELEIKLADIWKEVLNVERVGINDNFFELGGDSIITIQVVSRARHNGINLKPKDIFVYQTIGKLTAALTEQSKTEVTAEQGELTGESGLLPIQQAFLDVANESISHFNQSILLSIDKSVTSDKLGKAVEQLTLQHDALRFRYQKTEGQWHQVYGSNNGILITVDLKSAKENTLGDLIKEQSDKFQRSLDIEKGELVRFVLIQTPESESHNRIMIVIHHLAIDGVSWRILLDDLEVLLDSYLNGGKTYQVEKSSSYRQWYEALAKYSHSKRLLSQFDHWEKVSSNYEPVITDLEYSGKVKVKDIVTQTVSLDAEHTQSLLQDVPRVYHTDINDILLCALAMTICSWRSADKVTIGMEGHGRENISDEIDSSRTVGWFTSMYPVLIEISKNQDISDTIKSVKEQLRRVPDKGLGFGVLKYINKNEKLSGKECFDILFNYLGQTDSLTRDDKWISGKVETAGSDVSEETIVNEKITINSIIQEGQLVLNWNFSGKHFKNDTISKLSSEYISNLQELISHCINYSKLEKSKSIYTPSDFGLSADISYKELDKFLDRSFGKTTRRDNIDSIYRLSALQQGMLFHSLYDSQTEAYTEQFTCDIINPDLDRIETSWDYVIKRHSILRSGFYNDEFSIPVQCVYTEAKMPVTILDYSKMDQAEQTVSLIEFEETDRKAGFDFKSAPLMRTTLIRLSKDRYRMIWTSHHILYDGWSLPVIMEEFLNAYENQVSGKDVKPADVDRYEDYIKYLENLDSEQQEIYWRNYMKGAEQNTLLPFIGTSAQRTKGVGNYENLYLKLDKETNDSIISYSQKNHLTFNTIIQGVWSTLLHQYTGNKDATFGVTVSGRPVDLPEVEQRVGMYINTIPLHSILRNDEKVTEWLKDLQNRQTESIQHQYASLQDIRNWTGASGDTFDSLLVFENYPFSELIESKNWSLKVENVNIREQTNFPLTILVDNGEETIINFSYNTDLLDKVYAEEIRGHFEHVLKQMVTDSDIVMRDLELLTKSEKDQILYDFNDTDFNYTINKKDKNIADLFEEQVAKSPDTIALVFEDEKLTYKELNELSNKIAHYLLLKGVKEDTLVPICMERSVDMIAGVLAILKAGGAYVPIDPDYPAERISFMLKDTGAGLMLSNKDVREKLSEAENIDSIENVEIDSSRSEIEKQSSENLTVRISPDNLAYMLYTSGSTGNPKGVRMPGSSLVNLLLWQDKQFENKQRKVLQFTSLNFDVSFQEIFSTLCFGSTLCLISSDRRIDMSEVIKDISKYGITHLFVPYIVLKNLAEQISSQSGETYSLEEIITAGEQLKLTQELDKLLSKGIKLINQYGPTEAHVVSSYTVVGNSDITPLPPIGKPVDNTQLYILNDKGEPVPIGASGELYIGGAQLARGYLNLPELTKEKFIENPFSKDPESRLYKTGDLARWLPDGNIEYLGRADDQIKIRGYRVELGEIESVLQQSELVREAVVLTKEDNAGNKRLIGYVVTEEVFYRDAIVSYLKSKLPEYMIPGIWVEMESLPLTANGKIDRRALPDPDISELSSIEYAAPGNAAEEKLAVIFQELLGLERVGVNDNFFEIGGHSLLAMRVISSIRREMEIEIAIKDIFTYPTVSELAKNIESQNKGSLLKSVEVSQRPERIPLSFSQERLWFIDRLEGSVSYHLPSVLRLKGKLNKDALRSAMQSIVNRHEVLRTVIGEDKGIGYQKIKEKDLWKLEIVDGSIYNYKKDSKKLQSFIQELIDLPFDLSNDHMLRGHLIELDDNENILVVTMHHIASDGWSVSVIVKELAEFYKAYEEGREADLNPLQIQYADYAIWQRDYLPGEVLDTKLEYWNSKLQGTEPLDLPTDFTRPAIQSTKGSIVSFRIEKELLESLETLSKKNGTTLYMTLLSSLNILLYKYTGQNDISVGSPIAGRQQKEIEDLIGFFINTLVFRNEVNSDKSFTELLNEVKTTTLEAYEHQDVPFEKIVDSVVSSRDMSRTPLFQVMFMFQNTPDVPELKLGEVKLIPESSEFTTAKFDLTFTITQTTDGLNGTIDYCTDLFKEETIERMTGHFKELLNSIVSDPEQNAGALSIITEKEKYQLLKEFNDTAIDYQKDKTFIDLFEEQADINPDNPAIVFEDRMMTYKDLNEQANRLANYLKSEGVKSGTLVPLCIERSPEMIIGLLGIIKSGAAFVPIDPEYPEDRISYMLEDSGATIVVSNKNSRIKLSENKDISVIEIDGDSEKINKHSSEKPEAKILPENLAYVIFTSGSTGKPKGVMIEHESLLNLLFSMTDLTEFKQDSAFLSVTTFSFDICYLEFFMPLINGGKLIIASREVALDGYKLSERISKNRPTHMQGTPSTWQLLLESKWQNEEGLKILVGGEALKDGLKDQLTKIGTAYNLYGPTETTIWSTIDSLKPDAKVLIGSPIANTSILILDNENGLVPIGVSGEILIGGSGLARGYLNKSELTSEKFIADPFQSGSRIYKTGDKGRWLSDGRIEYLGRTDEQVKIRGYRIELGEIETVLLESDMIQQAVVIAKEDKTGNKRLVGYVVTEKDLDKDKIAAHLKNKLPDYMIPALWVELETLPLTPNGKINRKALPDPDLSDLTSNEYVAPRNESEEKLAAIYEELLGLEQVGINDNFFELGGHSLLAMRVISMIRADLRSEVAIKDIFIHPTIAELSAYINTHRNDLLLPPIEIQPRPNLIPLSYSQERLWFIDRMEGSVQYHVPAILQLKGKLNEEAMKYALKSIVDRHEVLRSVLREEKGVGYQVVEDSTNWKLQFENGTGFGKDENALREFIKELVDRPYDLSQDYMFRAHLIKMGEDDHILVVILHHIASDGWSVSILVRELIELYESYEENRTADIPELPLQYADYALWQRNYVKGEILENKLQYWKDKLEGVQQLQLPTDFNRPSELSNKGDNKSFLIDNELAKKLQELSNEKGTTLFMTLLAVFKVLLYRYSGQEDICVGSPIAGRQQKEVEGLIGFFVNSLSIRSEVKGEQTFSEFLKQLKTTMLEAYENQEVPFETVVDAMVKERDVNKNPLFQVMFALQNVPEVMKLRLGDVQLSNYGDVHKTSKFDLTIYTIETAEGIEGLTEYSTDLFSEQTIERMIGHYLELLHSVVADPDQKLVMLPMLNKAEENQLLEVFNDTASEYPKDKSLAELFDEQTLKTPDIAALAFEGQEMSYKELNDRANRLANYLLEKGITPGENIGLLSFRGFDMIIGMMGILKAGCAYVPFNTDYPAERLHFIIEDCAIKNIVFTNKKLLSDSGLSGFEFISVNESQDSSPEKPDIESSDIDNCAYVMFTSGTTGRPKGIAVSHRNIIKLVYDTGVIAIREGDRVLQWSNYSFDGSTYDIYNTLLTGASLYLIQDDWASDVDAMSALIESKNINVCFITTALFNTFIDIHPQAFTGMRKILFGGEMVSVNHVRKALSILGENVVTHVYGPTETTVYATSYPINEVKKDEIIPIGRPLSNTSLFVLNPYGKLVPVGVSGELFIGGDGVSMGYVNNPGLTKEKFVPNPYGKNNNQERLYRTGDLVRWLPEGNIEYLGREDHQVKIRGYRIELGEIESLMNGLKEVAASCVVITKDQAQTNKLVAYYVPVWDEVKSRESDLYQKHIDNWNQLYEIEYGKSDAAEDTDYEFNIIGWNDSFTGKEIPAEFMRQWLDDITNVILDEKPQRVLEIGTGTGLIYYQIADHIEKYVGIDFSEVSMNQIENQIAKGEKEYPPTDLKVGFAHEVELDEKEKVDMIILNSIVQYFPGEKYLTDILDKSFEILRRNENGSGKIIVGDVRDNRLLKAFKGRLFIDKSKESLSIQDFNWGVDQEVSYEEELCFSPEYFYNLKAHYPEITHIDIQWKQGDYENELTLYRYTATIYVGIDKDIFEPEWQTWDKEEGKERILKQINAGDKTIALKDLPNPRLNKEILLEKGLKDKSVKTVRDLSEYINKPDPEKTEETNDIYEIISTAISKGYKCKYLLDEDPLKINLILQTEATDNFIKQEYNYNREASKNYTSNVPLLRDIYVKIKKDVQESLKVQLPDYMVPSELIALQYFPLNSSGKTDRNFLIKNEETHHGSSKNYKPPVTITEKKLEEIWKDLLGVERIGLHDNFFELGGHSLLAMRVISAIRREMEYEIAIKDLFLHPTLAELGIYLDAQSTGLLLPAVEAQERPERLPLSFSQERLWFIDRMEGSVQYHVSALLRLKNKLNKDALTFALRNIVNRHEVLRTVILEDEGMGYQVVNEKDKWDLEFHDGTKFKNDKDGLEEYIQSLIMTPFDLSSEHMMKGYLIKIDELDHLLVVVMHHIASDGWSISVIVKELAEFYAAYEEKRESKLIPLDIQYADYAIWQRNYLQGEILYKKLEYWRNKLTGVEPLNLPTDFKRPSVQSTNGTSVPFKIDKELSDQLQELSQQNGVTLFMTLLAAFNVLLYRYSGQEDICVGTPIAGRQQSEIEALVGFFVNTLSLRNQVYGSDSFIDLLKEVSATTMGAYDHQDVPFEKVVETVVKKRDISVSPLFQVMFSLQNLPEAPELKLGDLGLYKEDYTYNTSKFDMSFFMNESPYGIQGYVEYCTDLFKDETIIRMISHFKELLKSIVTSPQQSVGNLPMLTGAEEYQLMKEFNDTKVEYPVDITIVDLFEEQAAKAPENTALVFENEKITYGELNNRANRIARYLQSKGVKSETLVPICIERGIDMIAGILGILKSGGTYVPMDPEYPEERIRYMLEDTGAEIVISSSKSSEVLNASGNVSIVNLDLDWSEISKLPEDNLKTEIKKEQLAYVIYTSGSTGKPKGVMISYKNIDSFIYWCRDEFNATDFDIVYGVTSICFDLSLYEIFYPLCTGKPLRILENGLQIGDYLNEDTKVMTNCVPVVVENLLKEKTDLANVTAMNMAGEPIPLYVQQNLDVERIEVRNLYGPTEDTTYSTNYRLEKGKPLLIGKPIANTQVHILNKEQALNPVGIPGEICLAGDGVTKGYLNKKELTAEKFVKDPFTENGKMYKTGDIGRWLSDGNIEYLGRMDGQIKIRGFRIELGEIESVLQECDLIEQAVVLVKVSDEGDKRLVGYAVPAGEFAKEEIINYLKSKLPDFMIPAIWVEMESLPLTPNKKIDRKALPDPVASEFISNEYIAPRNETEEKLANIWKGLLHAERVGINDNFFELGGHSLLVMRVISSVRRELKSELTIKDFFNYATISGLASLIDNGKNGSEILLPAIVAKERPEFIPLSFSQERIWFIDKLEGSIQYHMPAVLRLKGKVNSEALISTFKNIVNRHEVLRTVIKEHEGKAYQFVNEKDGFELEFIDGIKYNDDPKGLENFIQELINIPFDLASDNMLRGHLIKLTPDGNENILVITMHHIASDGWSVSVIVKELVEYYKAYEEKRNAELAPLEIQFADYSLWQREYLKGDVLENKLKYWKDKLNGVEPLQLPTDFARPAIQSKKGANAIFRIDKDLKESLLKFSRQHDVTLFMTLLTAYNVMLYRYSGQEDFCVGSPVAGRQVETEDMIGFFINTVALRSEIDGEVPFSEFLQKVKSTTLEAYEHQDVPFEKIVDSVVKQRDMSRSPLFQVSFMLQNTPEVPELKLGDAILEVEEFSNNISKIDITFSLAERPDGIDGVVEYCTDLYSEETILRMTSHFNKILTSILEAPHQKIGTLNMITEKEEKRLLIEFNDNARDYPKEKTIVDIIEQYGNEISESIALEYEDEKVTYRELNERANQFANFLKEKGVKTETLVPICIDRSIEMIIAIFGILKAGAAYVPIDPEYPEDRMQFMLEDINASLIVTSRKTFDSGLILPELNNLEVIEIDSDRDETNKHSKENLQTEITPSNLAYVIYTSGSTGKPKGVMIEHKGVVNLALSQEELLWLKPEMKTLQFASSGFDASCYDIFNTLLSKGCLVLCNKEDILSADKFEKLINDHRVELATLPSSFQQTIKDSIGEMATIKTIVSAGEALNIETAETFKSNGIRVVNAYGPTETTVCATLTDDPIKEHNIVTIGKPNPNQQVYIVDKYMNICPVGVPGEICVAGMQVARGYLNRPELSSEKFTENIFGKGNSSKLYRTGDLGKWLSDGNIEYLGRIDDQVKLRGYRIELGEIENVLQQSEYVKQAVVMVKEDEIGNKRLAGYIVPAGEFEKEEIINYIKKKLPEYMIPALWVEMENLPVTPSGKIDRKALPEPEAGSISTEYAAPRNKIEIALCGIWKELLHAEQVGIHDNFFDLGGDSIITIQVQSRARRLGYELKPNDIFIHQTISSLSAALAERSESAITGEQGILSGKCGLLPIQQWYFEGAASDISHFNQSVLLSIDKSVTPEVLNNALNKLTVQHDALRFIYHLNKVSEDNKNKWDQEYGFNTGKLIDIDLQSVKEDDLGNQINEHSDKIQRSLDIEKGEIAKFALFRTQKDDNKNRILIVIHHLAIDGVSWRIILDDLELLITGLMKNEEVDLGVKSSSYRQWYNALEEFSQSEKLLSQSKYWEDAVSDIDQIPTDKEYAGKVKEKDMELISHHFDNAQTELLLHEVPRVYHTDINDMLLCALAQTFTEKNATQKIVIGLEGHGRENIAEGLDTSRTVGWFTSLYPVSLEISPNWDTSDSIKRVKEQLRQIPDKGLGFGILKYLNRNEKLNTKSSWNIVFNYLGQIDNIVDSGNWFSGANEPRGENSGADHTISYIIAINSMVQEGELILNWSYSKLHFEKETITGLAESFNSNLRALIDHCMDQQKSGSVYTPSDYGLESDISIDELDQLLNKRI